MAKMVTQRSLAQPAIPYESYTEKETLEAIDLAKGILEVVKNKKVPYQK